MKKHVPVWIVVALITVICSLFGILYANMNDSLKTLDEKKVNKEYVDMVYKDAVDSEDVSEAIDLHVEPIRVKIKNIETDISDIKEYQKEQRDQFAEFQKSQIAMMNAVIRIEEKIKKE